MQKYYANILGEFIYDFEFNQIPAPVIQKAKASILDNLGLALGVLILRLPKLSSL